MVTLNGLLKKELCVYNFSPSPRPNPRLISLKVLLTSVTENAFTQSSGTAGALMHALGI